MKIFKWMVAILLICEVQALALAETSYFVTEGTKNNSKIALTFDDGPGHYTTKILDILDQYNIKATFFMNGDQVKIRPKIAQEVLKRGHEIADHTYSHMNFYAYEKKQGLTKTQEKIDSEIELSRAEIKKVTGQEPVLCRMPYGYHRNWMDTTAKKFNITFVNWTFGEDWTKIPKEKMAKDYVDNVHAGAILLLHDGGKNRQKTVDILPQIIAQAKKKNLTFSTIGELLRAE